jgi:hypothetical protein
VIRVDDFAQDFGASEMNPVTVDATTPEVSTPIVAHKAAA